MKTIILQILLWAMVLGCSSGSENLKKFAGGYTVEIKGVSPSNLVEAYGLKENGDAIWMYIENDGKGGAKLTAEKKGKWYATETEVKIQIFGNTGMLEERYILMDQTLVNKDNHNRYLKRNK